ncbi:MAG TPA: dienelactone hydrolase family protein [Wenzhouxiangella sp.]
MKTLTINNIECVVVETAPQPSVSVIWLHGLGADGNDFVPIVPQLQSAKDHGMRFVFPNAPIRPVTLNGGMAMRAWYDILGFDIDRDQDAQGIGQSVQSINGLVASEFDSPGIERVGLAGFSQGGAIALRAGLACARPLFGIVALSTYLLQAKQLDQWLAPAQSRCPIYMAHGSHDPIVPLGLGESAHRTLTQAGLDVNFQTWPMAHEVSPQEVEAIDAFLSVSLAKHSDVGHET